MPLTKPHRSLPIHGVARKGLIVRVDSISKSEENKNCHRDKNESKPVFRARDVTAVGDVNFTSREPNYDTADVIIRLLAQSFT